MHGMHGIAYKENCTGTPAIAIARNGLCQWITLNCSGTSQCRSVAPHTCILRASWYCCAKCTDYRPCRPDPLHFLVLKVSHLPIYRTHGNVSTRWSLLDNHSSKLDPLRRLLPDNPYINVKDAWRRKSHGHIKRISQLIIWSPRNVRFTRHAFRSSAECATNSLVL